MKKKILLVEDDISLREVINYKLKKMDLEVESYNEPITALKEYKKNFKVIDLIITDYKMPQLNGLEFLKMIKQINRKAVVIVITAFADVNIAVDVMKSGAFDFITKPFEKEHFKLAVERALDHSALIYEVKQLKSKIDSKIVYKSDSINEIIELSDKVATNSISILITGESGTGKELIARRIHNNSNRSNYPFVAVNCGAIPKDLIESELFGHVKGAYTGAVQKRKGKFQKANKGTIFLDEIGELPLEQQTILLRVLQENTINAVGSDEEEDIDVRIISATNKNLSNLVSSGKFRDDLFYRLNVLPINIPPLRDRLDDLDVLVPYFVEKYSNVNNMIFENGFISKLKDYYWPGNVRELENIIRRILILNDSNKLTKEMFTPDHKVEPKTINDTKNLFTLPKDGVSLEELEKQIILKALSKNDNNQSKTARFLRIPRHVLIYKLDKYSKGD